MAKTKKLTDLIDYAAVLPYASEMFGIYQPLIGWKSKRISDRFNQGFLTDKRKLLNQLKNQFNDLVDIQYESDCKVRIRLRPGVLNSGKLKTFDSVVLERIAEKLPPYEEYKEEIWPDLINPISLDTIFKHSVVPAYTEFYSQICQNQTPIDTPKPDVPRVINDIKTGAKALENSFLKAFAADTRRAVVDVKKAEALTIINSPILSVEDPKKLLLGAFENQLRYESSLAGALLFLAQNNNFIQLANIFYNVKNNAPQATELEKILSALRVVDGYLNLNNLDPQDRKHIESVALSPISVVHLFRQYFFELDTFLGTPVSHVWLSPGATVELIEIQTRNTLVEKTLETFTETVSKAESEVVQKDEISEAIKEDNKQDIKFGASVSASYASVTATSSFDYTQSQQVAREETHKRMRQQTEKLSSEIRKNFKTTLKTVTETTDTSSKRYLLTNPTSELINYELRRKMRQVAVQVQDIGTYLCWQTYVDRPGESLGVANLVHVAKPAELDGLHEPDEIPLLQPFQEQKVVTIPFVSIKDSNADNEGEVYRHGREVDDSEVAGNLELIKANFKIECICSKSNYVLTNVEFDGNGKPVYASLKGEIKNEDNKASFTLHLDSVDFQGQNSVPVRLILQWSPAPHANDEAVKKNEENKSAFKAKERMEREKAYIENMRDRVKLSHQIKSRPSEELRDEERIVVYRKLIQEMLTHGITMPDDRSRHVVAELINSIFDIDKMLYFVAPEWWRSRIRTHRQQLDESALASTQFNSPFSSLLKGTLKNVLGALTVKSTNDTIAANSVGWGGIDDAKRDNYYITDDSEPAKFGSSLGWLLQLDGDNMRNAFLNAPWVKAVIPIRPGKEEAAVNWLKGVEGFNGIDENDIYQTNNPDEKDIDGIPLNGQKMIDVIMDLAKKIQRKHQEALENGQFPKKDEISDPELVDEDNVVTSTPIDRVYEHGFYPLKSGFRANVKGNYEIFDQWLEILPTDQVVPVEVEYDPRTGRQV